VQLTFIGLLCNITAYTIIAVYQDSVMLDLPGPPRWACALFSVLLWIYMTLDWIDGKQARRLEPLLFLFPSMFLLSPTPLPCSLIGFSFRTGTSSPLGELFDHVCDASSLCVSLFGPRVFFFNLVFLLLLPSHVLSFSSCSQPPSVQLSQGGLSTH
jgi:phosphatidylglycerophosphate synthase